MHDYHFLSLSFSLHICFHYFYFFFGRYNARVCVRIFFVKYPTTSKMYRMIGHSSILQSIVALGPKAINGHNIYKQTILFDLR